MWSTLSMFASAKALRKVSASLKGGSTNAMHQLRPVLERAYLQTHLGVEKRY